MSARGVLRIIEGGELAFWCKGCNSAHAINIDPAKGRPCWTFDGNYDKPTFKPSLHIRYGHFVPGAQMMPDGRCGWCVDAAEDGHPTMCGVCHSFVTAGSIQFLSDCTHALAGKTIPLEPFL